MPLLPYLYISLISEFTSTRGLPAKTKLDELSVYVPQRQRQMTYVLALLRPLRVK